MTNYVTCDCVILKQLLCCMLMRVTFTLRNLKLQTDKLLGDWSVRIFLL